MPNNIVDIQIARDYMRIDGDVPDSVIQLLVASAAKRTEDYCATNWRIRPTIDTHIGTGRSDRIYLYRSPVISVESVSINGTPYDGYTALLPSGEIIGSWDKDASVVVQYTAGYIRDTDDPLELIPDAVSAILLCAATWYNNPTGTLSDSVTGIGSVNYGEEVRIPQAAMARLAALRRRPIL